LAAALLLAVASVPCPATLLDDTTHNVGVEDILAPRGTIDSGQTIIPRCVVANYGDSAESLWAHFVVEEGGIRYHDSLWLQGLAPAARETASFSEWIPDTRDSMEAIAWTECASDTFPHDDSCRVRFLVQVIDIALQIVFPAPGSILDSGDVIHMMCRAWNYGNRSVNFDLRFRIWPLDSAVIFESHRNLNLIAGGATMVTSPDSWTAVPGTYVAEFCALVSGDMHPENNTVSDTFYVSGLLLERDVAAIRMETSVPPDSIRAGEPFAATATVANLGGDAAAFKSWFLIRDSSGTPMYFDSANHMLGPGDSTAIRYPFIILSAPGNYVAVCSVHMTGDQNPTNDVVRLVLHVLPAGAVGETASTERPKADGGATVMRDLPAGAVVFDAMGRRVVNPKPGVYFVKEQSAFSSQHSGAAHVRKVILQR
jgi:hypothetical protein